MKAILFVGFGGAVGSILRYSMGNLIKPFFKSDFPFHTLAINLLGCFCIGFLVHNLNTYFNPTIKQWFIIAGVLGGFTTFSTYSMETVELINKKMYVQTATYVVVSTLGGIALTYLGYKLSNEFNS